MDLTVPRTTRLTGACGRVAPVLQRVGDKWTVLVIVSLDHNGPMRFNALKRSVDGISQQMLTRVLKALERDGMVSRTTFPTSPPQVEYELTELGRSLSIPVLALGDWVLDHLNEIDAARQRYDQR
ncbi:helix-turn-helix domain-containing protein [Martelella sp. HB161492]|uniref:winged helix-turn-helix transcriptional regulator n=1 Tax=Martelella sp. HB161492 TaxID=2720726 RepID=UPI00158FD953|nr:helix-turn-helix domain-containing protein [Martelella sp. HB161492]